MSPFDSSKHCSKTAVYAGTFDPVTNGHLDIVRRALKVFDGIYLAVAGSSTKNVLFSLEERVQMIREAVSAMPFSLQERILVDSFNGLLVNYVRSVIASAIVRGLRAVSDYEYEAQMALINRAIQDEVETVFLVTSSHCAYISSSVVKDIARNGGDVSQFVPRNVLTCLSTIQR